MCDVELVDIYTRDATLSEHTTSPPYDTATKIHSNNVLRITQVAFVMLLIVGVIYNIHVAILSYDFFTEQADTLLTHDLIATLYPWFMIVVRAIVTIGCVIFLRTGDNRIGMITSFFLLLFGVAGISYIYRTPDASNYIADQGIYLSFAIITEFAYIALSLFMFTFRSPMDVLHRAGGCLF